MRKREEENEKILSLWEKVGICERKGVRGSGWCEMSVSGFILSFKIWFFI